MKRSFLLLAWLALSACAVDTNMSLAGFDTTCAQDQDCVPVQEGDICGCDCGNAAINVKGLATYQEEFQSKETHCTTKDFCDCVAVTAVCVKGQCAVKSP